MICKRFVGHHVGASLAVGLPSGHRRVAGGCGSARSFIILPELGRRLVGLGGAKSEKERFNTATRLRGRQVRGTAGTVKGSEPTFHDPRRGNGSKRASRPSLPAGTRFAVLGTWPDAGSCGTSPFAFFFCLGLLCHPGHRRRGTSSPSFSPMILSSDCGRPASWRSRPDKPTIIGRVHSRVPSQSYSDLSLKFSTGQGSPAPIRFPILAGPFGIPIPTS